MTTARLADALELCFGLAGTNIIFELCLADKSITRDPL